MFDIIREYFEARRHAADTMRSYARTIRNSDRKMDKRAREDRRALRGFTTNLDKLGEIAVAWLKTPNTRSGSTVAFDLFTVSLLRGLAAGSDEVASYLDKKVTLARDEETRFTESQYRGVELARVVGDALMREGQGYEITVKDGRVADKAAAVIREQLLQDTEVVLQADGTVLLKVTAGAASSNCAKPQGSRVAEIIGTVHMAEGKLCSFLVDPQEAHAIATLILKHCSRPVVIEDGEVPGKSHLIVRGKGGDVH